MSYGLYIHLPFCRSRCPYCAFYSTLPSSRATETIEAYIAACSQELVHRTEPPFTGFPETVYIGGGTPSLVEPSLLGRLFSGYDTFTPQEFSIEANPESVTRTWLEGIHALGVDRISIGVQALDDRLLKLLGRIHTSEQARTSVKLAVEAGFRSLSLDLMFGIPGQSVEDWKATLEAATSLDPDHISAYSLGIEEDTEYCERMKSSGLAIPDESETAEMYHMLWETLRDHGYYRYELSNFARPGHECRHNQHYWDFTPYIGIGASAHSFNGTVRSWNMPDIDAYIKHAATDRKKITDNETLAEEERAIEQIMLRLRTADGFSVEELPSTASGAFGKTVDALTTGGYIRINSMNRITLTNSGAILADEIIAELAASLFEGV